MDHSSLPVIQTIRISGKGLEEGEVTVDRLCARSLAVARTTKLPSLLKSPGTILGTKRPHVYQGQDIAQTRQGYPTCSPFISRVLGVREIETEGEREREEKETENEKLHE